MPQKARVADPKTNRRTVKPSSPDTRAAPPPDAIALRAYEIWRESGCPDGKHDEHWLQAERELRAAQRSSPARE